MNKMKINDKNRCPNEEIIACYIDGLLSSEEHTDVEKHLSSCINCKEIFFIQAEIARQQKGEGLGFIPAYVTEEVKDLIDSKYGLKVLKVITNFSDKIFETIRTTGEIILGNQLQPSLALRDRSGDKQIKTFSVRKVFDNTRIDLEVSRESGEFNTIIVRAMDNKTEMPKNDLRVTLIKNNIELESYITQSGKSVFENVRPGEYIIEISQINNIVGAVSVDLNKA